MKDLKISDKLCFINFIFKNGCTDSVAVAGMLICFGAVGFVVFVL